MQPLAWYLKRLRAMGPDEVAWRAASSLRDVVDRFLVAHRQRLLPLSELLSGDNQPGFRVTDIKVGQWASAPFEAQERQWLDELLAKANGIAARRLSYFDLEDQPLGNPIDWNRDHKAGKPAPMTFAQDIDYRDSGAVGDCKYVWEPSRHHQLVVLGRAYRAGGDVGYAKAIIEQIEGWLDQCPVGIGMQWRSPLELGIRLINWVWAVDLIRESGLLTDEFLLRLLNGVHSQVREVARRHSYGSSANNHLIGEAAGVFVAASYFSGHKNAKSWRARSHRLLCREIVGQTYGDGGTREQAIGYHLFDLQFFVICGLVARRAGIGFPTAYWNRLRKMLEFTSALSEGGQNMPMFGDADDGYVLDLGGDPTGHRQWLAAGAQLVGQPQLGQAAGADHEAVEWLLGRSGRRRSATRRRTQTSDVITSRAFRDSGYYLLQCGQGHDRISIVLDCGELGMGALAAHGHADALSFTLRAFGVDVLVDPGAYDYFTYPKWRDYFRSTRAHNTIVVDGKDQSAMEGLFLWGQRANARCVSWEPSEKGGRITAEHDGYKRLADPTLHRRTLELDGERRELIIHDHLSANRRHQVAAYFHLAEQCELEQVRPNEFRMDPGPGIVTFTLDPRLAVDIVEGMEKPIGGWVSRGYHRKTASKTIVGRCQTDGKTSLSFRIGIGPSRLR